MSKRKVSNSKRAKAWEGLWERWRFRERASARVAALAPEERNTVGGLLKAIYHPSEFSSVYECMYPLLEAMSRGGRA